jgi:4-amino-4-deoxychorismate lyase
MSEDFKLFSSLRYDPGLTRVPSSDLTYAGWNGGNESPFYMLEFHRDRMLRAATHWNWTAAIEALSGDAGLERLRGFLSMSVGHHQKTPMRVKVTISKEGQLEYEASETPSTELTSLFPESLPPPGQKPEAMSSRLPAKGSTYEVVIDNSQTTQSEYTHYKTSRRDMYNAARERAIISLTDKREVLLVNEADNSIMEGTLTTPYFWRNGRWVTPPVGAHFAPGRGSGGQDGTTRRWMLERYVHLSVAAWFMIL